MPNTINTCDKTQISICANLIKQTLLKTILGFVAHKKSTAVIKYVPHSSIVHSFITLKVDGGLYLIQRLGIGYGNNVLGGTNKSQTAAVTAHGEGVWSALRASSYHIT